MKNLNIKYEREREEKREGGSGEVGGRERRKEERGSKKIKEGCQMQEQIS